MPPTTNTLSAECLLLQIFLTDPSQDLLRPTTLTQANPTDVQKLRAPSTMEIKIADGCLIGSVALSRSPIVLKDAARDSRYNYTLDRLLQTARASCLFRWCCRVLGRQTKSLLLLPIELPKRNNSKGPCELMGVVRRHWDGMGLSEAN